MENLINSIGPRGRLADIVARQLERLILEGKLEPGTRLPSETDLCQQFNVSRTVIREAVNSVEAKGLVETRQGVGTTVLPANRDAVVSSLNRLLQTRGGDPGLRVAALPSAAHMLPMSAQLRLFFHQCYGIARPGDGKRAFHAGDAAPYHQCALDHWDFADAGRRNQRGPGHAHADAILELAG